MNSFSLVLIGHIRQNVFSKPALSSDEGTCTEKELMSVILPSVGITSLAKSAALHCVQTTARACKCQNGQTSPMGSPPLLRTRMHSYKGRLELNCFSIQLLTSLGLSTGQDLCHKKVMMTDYHYSRLRFWTLTTVKTLFFVEMPSATSPARRIFRSSSLARRSFQWQRMKQKSLCHGQSGSSF